MTTISEAFDLTSQVALVTGAGRGLGRAISARLAEAGATVVCADIDHATATATAALIRDDGHRAAPAQLDVTRRADVEADPDRPCPFCPGHEESSAGALESLDEGGHWRMRVVPNLYPAFDGDEPFAVHHHGPVHVEADKVAFDRVGIRLTRDRDPVRPACAELTGIDRQLIRAVRADLT